MHALPHNLEAEQALLGALLFDNRILECFGDLRPEHFYDPVHGRIYRETAKLITAGALADGVTLKERFAHDGGIKEIGGAVYLMRLMDMAAPLSAQAQSYAELIRDLALRRDIIGACRAAASYAAHPPEDADGRDALEEAERLLLAIEVGGADGVSLRDAGRLAVANAARCEHGIKTGLLTLDTLIGGLYSPDLIVLAGRPSMGKTSLAANVAHAIAKRDYVVHFASCEMSAEQIAQRALSRTSFGGHGAFSYRDFRRGGVDLDRAGALAERLPESFVIDDAGAQTLSHLRAAARATRRRCGRLDLIVVDYLQLMSDPAIKRGDTAEVTALTKGLKQIAKDLRAPLLCLSQLSRAVEQRQDKRPQLSDLRQSGSIEQDADIVLFVFRESYYLSRAKPVPEENESRIDFDVRYHKWADRCEETSGRMEVIAAKTRMDETGSNYLQVDLAYDIASDPPDGRPLASAYRKTRE